jgi:hypothetical protein
MYNIMIVTNKFRRSSRALFSGISDRAFHKNTSNGNQFRDEIEPGRFDLTASFSIRTNNNAV